MSGKKRAKIRQEIEKEPETQKSTELTSTQTEEIPTDSETEPINGNNIGEPTFQKNVEICENLSILMKITTINLNIGQLPLESWVS